MKMWHITMLKLVRTLSMFLLVRCIFLFLDLKCYKYSLVLRFWILLWCFSLSSCVTFMPSHQQAFYYSCLKPLGLGKTHSTFYIWHMSSWTPIVLLICL
jgi:hypothetical protein